jgi:hypothetical protein
MKTVTEWYTSDNVATEIHAAESAGWAVRQLTKWSEHRWVVVYEREREDTT